MDVIIRNMDRDLYRRLKAVAALKGCRVADVIHEAAKLWLSMEEKKEVATEYDANNSEYERMKTELLKHHRGKYAVFFAGRLVGVADSLTEAGKIVREAGFSRALIAKVGEEEPAGGEWLWSSTELSTA